MIKTKIKTNTYRNGVSTYATSRHDQYLYDRSEISKVEYKKISFEDFKKIKTYFIPKSVKISRELLRANFPNHKKVLDFNKADCIVCDSPKQLFTSIHILESRSGEIYKSDWVTFRDLQSKNELKEIQGYSMRLNMYTYQQAKSLCVGEITEGKKYKLISPDELSKQIKPKYDEISLEKLVRYAKLAWSNDDSSTEIVFDSILKIDPAKYWPVQALMVMGIFRRSRQFSKRVKYLTLKQALSSKALALFNTAENSNRNVLSSVENCISMSINEPELFAILVNVIEESDILNSEQYGTKYIGTKYYLRNIETPNEQRAENNAFIL